MTARVLVVDDVFPNVKLLEKKLTNEYFDVLTATSGPEAIEIAQKESPDIILLDVMMPGMDGFEVCRHIKKDPQTAGIPVVMVTALDQPSDRITGLEAGADDFLTKPVQDIALFARVRSLVRLKVMMAELRNRETTESGIGGSSGQDEVALKPVDQTRVLLIVDDVDANGPNREALSEISTLTVLSGSEEKLMERVRERNFDLIIASLSMESADGLRICSQLRSYDETRQVPVLAMVGQDDTTRLVRALEMGINDYVVEPVDPHELMARTKTQLKRKMFADRLRESFHLSMQLATTDAVTGVYNRHYMTSHLETLLAAAKRNTKPLSVAMLDIDHFKAVNDTHGHAAGDQVLKEFAHRISTNIRGIDLLARYGGEEFVVVMPDTAIEQAGRISERIRATVSDTTFEVNGQEDGITITVSIGLASLQSPDDTGAALLEVADDALYEAKHAGRNRVVLSDMELSAAS